MKIIYTIPQNISHNSVLNNLRMEFSLRKDSGWSGDRCYYDTFDWRLYNNSFLFYCEQSKIYLISRKNQTLHECMTIKNIPRFSNDLSDGTFKDRLNSILEMRALIKLACHHVDQTKYRVLDKNDKTILYLIFEIFRLNLNKRSSHLHTLFTLVPIKGYEIYLAELNKKLQTYGLIKFKGDVFKQVLKFNHREPNDYSSKINIKLQIKMSACEATKTILSSLFYTMERNQKGIINDIDTEFLHDYRVAIRRIRSVFGQFKNVFKQEIYSKAKNDFSQLGRRTNRMRDIDVYLLRKTEYQDMLPDDMKKDINPFFTTMVKERKIELKKLGQYFNSEEYKNIINHWDKFIKESLADVYQGLESGNSVLPFAKGIIWKRYKKVIKLGTRITQSSPDVLLHQLRIECKKLRYPLEFFSSLFAKEEINYLINHLKILQDNLGDLNDLSIQQDTLRKYVETDSNKRTLLALGILIGKLNERQVKVRHKFSDTFQTFADQVTHSLFYKLFAPTAEKDK